MRHIKAREFMNLDIPGEWPLKDERLKIEFDDGVIETTSRRTVLSWFCWELHRKFPRLPLNICHHMGNDFPSADTIPKILSNIVRDLHYVYFNPTSSHGHDHCYDREQVWSDVKDVSNEIYNVMSIFLEEWHVSINAFHLLELYLYPPIKEVRGDIQPNQLSISRAYDRATTILMKDPALLNNPIVRGLRSKQIKMGQFLQILICRGYLTDADQVIFRKPITTGFFEGLTTLHDIMIESCSAKKALLFTKKPLRIVEYFNRKMQLSATVVDRLVWDDCGSTQYVPFPVDSSNLRYLEGSMYLDEDNVLTPVRESDRHLHGQTIRMRSPMFCNYRGDGAVCHVCFGELAWAVPRGTSLGHVSSTELCREGSQRTLSVKHLDGSSETEEIIIDEEYMPYIQVASSDPSDPEGEAVDEERLGEAIPQSARESSLLKFNPRLQKMSPVMILQAVGDKTLENASNLGGLTKDTIVERLNIHRFTSFREVQLKMTNLRDEHNEVYIPVSQGARHGSLSRVMIYYIQSNGYTVDENGNFCIDLSNWDFAAPAFSLPRRHASTLDFMAAVEAFIRSPAKKSERNGFNGRMLTGYSDPVAALIDFADLVNSQLFVNIKHLEVILLTLMRPADDPDDYRLPPIDRPAKFEEHRTLMQYRSLGQELAYERQPDMIEDPDSYLIKDRPPGLLDPFVYPEVINM
jgi:hypothetical protein